MKTLVVPDIHLKLYMIEKIKEVTKEYNVDEVIFMGDYFDDWGETSNDNLYLDTIKTIKEYKEECDKENIKTHFLIGNHEISYIKNTPIHHSNHSDVIGVAIRDFLKEMKPTVAYKSQGWLFSHAGILKDKKWYYLPFTEYNLKQIKELDKDNSPLWLRSFEIDVKGKQIVGHTPVKRLYRNNDWWYVDTWSTYSDKSRYGDQSLIIVEDGEIMKVGD